MIIDDEVGVLRGLQLMLEAAGFRVSAFSDPREAVHPLEQSRPQWLIRDLRMPEMDGFMVLQYRSEHCPEVPFILISGHAKQIEIERAKALGAQAVLQKPFAPSQLIEIIENGSRKHA